MTRYTVIQKDFTCANANGAAIELCFGGAIMCDPHCFDSLLQDCTNQWNCNLCQEDTKYFHPYYAGDKIMIQTQFTDVYNEDRENPASGFGTAFFVELCDADGIVISSNHTDFLSRWLVGWNEHNSYQVIEIDTSLITVDCWSVRIIHVNQGGGEISVCTHVFKHEKCRNLVEVEGKYSGFDCCGDYYGDPVAFSPDSSGEFRYRNNVRYYANFVETGASISKELFGTRSIRTTVECIYTLSLAALLPTDIRNMLIKKQLAGETVCINGVDYLLESFSEDNKITNGTMHVFDADLVMRCVNEVGCK